MDKTAVLIIDDENDICFLLGKLLSKKKYAVSIANTLKDGFSALTEVKPSILFLDIRLPDGSGLESLSAIRKQNPKLSIIMMSAHDGPNERKQAGELGADVFIGKPLNVDQINKTLEIIQAKAADI